MPIDLGLRSSLLSSGNFKPYVGLGGSHYFLGLRAPSDPSLDPFTDDGGDNEVGGYALAGARIGSPEGASVFVDGMDRGLDATVTGELLDNPAVRRRTGFNLDGVSVSAGVVWGF